DRPKYFHLFFFDDEYESYYHTRQYYVKGSVGGGKFSVTTVKRDALRLTTKGDRRLMRYGTRNTMLTPSRHGCTSNFKLSMKKAAVTKALRMWFGESPNPVWDETNPALCRGS